MSVHPHSLERLETRTCFAATTAVPPPPPPMTALADINGDGTADLVTLYAEAPATTSSTTPTKPTWKLKLQLGRGDGTFAAPKEFASPAQCPVSVAVADLDGDGKADIAILNRDPAPTSTTTTTPPPIRESIFIVRTDGKGAVLPPPAGTTAPKPIPLPDGFDGSSIAASDLNKDNLADLVAIGNLLPKPTSTTTTTAPKPVVNVATLLNTASAKGTFQKPALAATDANPGFYQLARAGDLDKNGSPDLVAYQVAPPPPPPGQTTTPPPAPTPSTQPPKNLAILLANGDGTVRAKSQANPLLPPPPTMTTSTTQQPPPVRTLGVSDLDGDGVADLMGVSATSVLVAKFDVKTMTFQAAKPAGSTNTPANLGASQVLLGDVNGDGKADLLALSDKGVFFGLNASKAGAPAFAWSAVKVA